MNILTTSSTRRTFRGLFRGLFGAFLQVSGYSGSFNSSCGGDQGTGGSTLSNRGLFTNTTGSADFTSRSTRLTAFSDFTGFNHRKIQSNTNNNKRIIILSIFLQKFFNKMSGALFNALSFEAHEGLLNSLNIRALSLTHRKHLSKLL